MPFLGLGIYTHQARYLKQGAWHEPTGKSSSTDMFLFVSGVVTMVWLAAHDFGSESGATVPKGFCLEVGG